uniref:Uncharacterized protein n=1 Tax=viral metagenome TaxID=1070528 RepID=A0A6C0C6I8_9ZZZZ
MDLSIALRIITFCESTRNYYLPTIVRNNITLLFKLTSKWLSLYFDDSITKTHLTIPIEKVLINLGDVISTNPIDDRLVSHYNDIFSRCSEKLMLGNKEIDDLVAVFKNVSLQYDMSDLMNDFSDVKIV